MDFSELCGYDGFRANLEEPSAVDRLSPGLDRRAVVPPPARRPERGGQRAIFTDKVSTTKAHHPGLADAVSHLRHGDVLVVWKLDRLGRTVKGLVEFVADLQEHGVQFRSLTDGIDTTTPAGRFFFHVMASLGRWSGSC
jgi:Resolvase, N terminal domain